MTARVRGLGVGLVLLGATACSLLISFDPDGQPCGLEEACSAGYSCVNGQCRLGGPPLDPCSQCKPEERCNAAGTACEPRTCANTPCPLGEVCSAEDGGIPVCVERQGLGQACAVDSDCSTSTVRVCVIGQRARPLADGGVGYGVCLDRCILQDGCPLNTGQVCTQFRTGLDAGIGKVCLPSGLLTPCTSEADCTGLSQGFTCALFANQRTGLLQACDLAEVGGAPAGGACGAAASVADGGAVRCGSGSCVAAGDGGSVCAPACAEGTCGRNTECRVVDLALSGVPVRPALCVAPTECRPCTDNRSCGADAPACATLTDGGTQRSVCLLPCSPVVDGGAGPCPAAHTCTDVGGALRCVPDGAGCP
ncbi:MAG: hypothetical protein RL653_2142 [Pseudomonadota bacterium]|jgi:hypothetical protein